MLPQKLPEFYGFDKCDNIFAVHTKYVILSVIIASIENYFVYSDRS